MPKIRTLWGLLAFLASLVLALLGVVDIAQLGVVAVIFGEHTAYAHIYPVLSIGIQILSYLAIAAILYLMGWSVVSYIKHRGKTDEPSKEVLAINELGEKLTRLLDTKKTGSNEDERG